MPYLPELSDTYSLHASGTGYIDLQQGKQYEIAYYTASFHTTKRFKGAKFLGYDIVVNRLVFLTPRGNKISVQAELFFTCVEVT